ncbi:MULTISPECIES: DUF1361 domain-containing protein [unclassified Parafrankia]|uniref:DUF1361 domain-containing protein n=1 Tax=unclassified Parafrankia TaxID=2994368 RepID=UPI000DA50D8C|nr:MULTISPECIES: DUF1361 domain-containing protein [unclassified Parafrankia]TCJ34765.1 DUF1361 domain-containing protein [Parafrankia sp. BMG5.11]CAI7979173.1 conserved membrane hypothetical protein [Frankia sp. Hr75.2]SQD93710.1 conserved membrane hypothetical protein [Parafrankia sp. Ea1.12]
MGVLEVVAPSLTEVVRGNARWMMWNTLLAWAPVVLACGLFLGGADRHPPRSPLWWAGLVLFALFLPNAPYVVTDLVHLRDDVLVAGGDGPVVTAVLPVYAVFIGSGFLAYYLSLAGLRRYLGRVGRAEWQGRVTVAAHALCAVGIFLGRWARLNSWEPVVDPHGTFERIVLQLSWSWAPILILATFLVVWIGHFVTRAVAGAAWDAALRGARLLRVL